MFRFASPFFLVLMIGVLFVFLFRQKSSRDPKLMVSFPGAIDDPFGSFAALVSKLLPGLKYLALVLLILALARPQWGTEKRTVVTRGINIVLALDLSRSMAALDFKLDGSMVTRLDAVKNVVKEFIMKREGDRIGMVVFGSRAYTQIPLTRDYNTISFLLEKLEIGAAGPSTAVGDALGISLKRIKDIKSRSNIVILLTDGKSNAGSLSPETAADIAAQQGVKVYTIGVGGTGKAPFLVNDPLFGDRYVYREVEMDRAALESIAGKTGGAFFAAEDTNTLAGIYDSIDRLEKTDAEVTLWADYSELYPWFLVPALFLLALNALLVNTRFLRVP
ncbi:MAG: VWA domain-containing protein [Desulfobacteraceae bacterium]